MQQSKLLKTGLLTATILSMAACQNWTQPAATVQDGTHSGSLTQGNVVTTTLPDNNPYGTAPIDNPYGNTTVNTTPYTPPANTGSGNAYVGNYTPVDVNAVSHTVTAGDTVYNITKRYGITQDQLRLWNNLADNNIRLGSRLRVKPTDYVASNATQTVTQPITQPVVTQPTYTPPPVVTPPVTNTTSAVPSQSTSTTANGTRSVNGITWMRPTQGNIITQFTTVNKGVDIAGNAGQNVVAAADGKVVYSGSDLRGYGNLLIVQHNSTFLTAYGHNQKLLVKENDTVKRGQTIAHMGNSHTDRYKLHFEVRQNGKPVNPLEYIPN
ncbi:MULTISPECIES: peptidoglycan DD-metalloendopeptidase family protein [Vitreoscilla]|uniref:Peptidoglycan DD-metalloendopeptidase family protein n=1 Tax=Vitreoscilla stercoraria TaxID=61 RepID=A0ABY4E807_VITST|nr:MULTISPECIES: peptidoglycan DD-metalloendopeptidase family protein [Vitreoscilla]AUZ04381.1 peptidase M23 [Vitreoscilla sp. C1]UOO91891.1 peptidoglycan DD-metalloendopeptidase family protein [Vitreoscilla stercoraria]